MLCVIMLFRVLVVLLNVGFGELFIWVWWVIDEVVVMGVIFLVVVFDCVIG